MAEILIISAEMPYPVRGGDQLRQYNLIKRIAQHHNVYLATFLHGKEEEEIGVQEMRKYCKGVHVVHAPKFSAPVLMRRFISNLARWRPLCESYHFVPVLEAKVREITSKQNFDIIQAEHVYMSEYAHCAPKNSAHKKILTLIDIESIRIKRQFFLEPIGQNKVRYLIDWLVMKSFEPRSMRRMDKCIAMSEIEAKIARKMAPMVDVEVVPNGVDSKLLTPVVPSKEKQLLMIGSLCYPPNIDGAEYFVKKIFPLIRTQDREIKLNIVGRAPTPRVQALACVDGVALFSNVPEVRPFYERSAVSVVPLRSGGGTRLKILESMAFGVPVVSTSIGCEGLDVTNGKNILIADTPKTFAENVIRILNDQSLRDKLIQNGRKLVEEKYDWDIIAQRLLKIYDELLG